MNHLILLNESIQSGFQLLSLDILSFLSILSGILVIITKNPVISVLFLIALFVTIASYLILIGINFLGLTYILVYVGAIAVLFLFIIMLLNIKLSELETHNSQGVPLGSILGILFLFPIYAILPSSLNIFPFYSSAYEESNYLFYNISSLFSSGREAASEASEAIPAKLFMQINNQRSFNLNYDLYFIHTDNWDINYLPYSQISSIGNIMYSNYSIWLIITSLILLLAMIGSIELSLKSTSK